MAGTDLADLALVPGELEEARAALPGVGDTVLVRAGAVHRAGSQEARLHYHAAAGGAQAGGVQGAVRRPAGIRGGKQVTATAIPYSQRDSRDGRRMQVWIPAAPCA